MIPNRKMIESMLINHSQHGGTRVEIPITIASHESIAKARAALLAAAASVDHVASSPEPDVVVEALRTGGVDLRIRVWIDDAQHERPVLYRVTEACKEALDQAKVEIPSPQIQCCSKPTRRRRARDRFLCVRRSPTESEEEQ